MLNIIYSNRYEVLRQCLIENLRLDYSNATIDPVFSPLQVIVPSDAVSDDLMRAMARHPDAKGVCMGLEMLWMSGWMRPYGSLWLGKGEIGKTLEWMIWDILDKGALDKDVLGELGHFLEKTKALPVRKYELAIRIAAVFTKYINYRFDWVLEWLEEEGGTGQGVSARLETQRQLRDRHPDMIWQKALWEKIRDGLGQRGHRKQDARGKDLIGLVRRIPESLAEFDSQDPPDSRALHFFMPQILPPLALPFLAKEASHREVWLYLMNPCKEYWFGADGRWFGSRYEEWQTDNAFLHRNASSTRALIDRIWRFAPEEVGQVVPLHEEAVAEKQRTVQKKPHGIPWNDLTETRISSVCQLDQADTPFVNSHMVYVRRQGKSLLDRIADSILFDRPLEAGGFAPQEDRSLRILKASGFVRQVEAVIDWIHAFKRDDPGLKPEDILVVTPQIDEMAPLIQGVMASQPEGQQIAYRILGRTELSVNTVASAILKTGRLVYSMMSAAAFSEALSLPLLTACWGISLEDVQVITRWLAAAGFRYGIDDGHLERLSATGQVKGAGVSDGTLERAMERLVLGRLTAEGRYQPYGDVLPVYGTENTGFDSVSDAEGAERLDVLTNIFMALKALYGRTFEQQTPYGWCRWVEDLLESLFPVGIDQKETLADIGSFRKTLTAETETMAAVLGDAQMPFEVFWMALEKGFVESPGRQHPDGCVTFAGMQDFRGLPFRAIAMVGMDDGPVFPGVNRAEEFDLTQPLESMPEAQKRLVRRRGDRDSREDNRNVFLDLLLAAQDRLLIVYDAGPEPTVPAKALNPSIVVQDLLFWLGESGLDTNAITSVLPLTRYSTGNLWHMADDGSGIDDDGGESAIRFFRTSDPQIESALGSRERLSEGMFVAGSGPLDPVFSEGATGTVMLPFSALMAVWNRPDTFVRKTIGMADVGWLERDMTPQIQMPGDRLFQKPLEKRILACLRRGETVDFLDDDPRIGCQDIRHDLLEPVRQAMADANALLESLECDGFEKRFSPVQVVTEGLTVEIVVPEMEHCRGGIYGQEGYVRVASSSRDRTSSWLLHLLISASDRPLPMYIVSWGKEGTELQRLPVFPEAEARQFLLALCQLYRKVVNDKTVFPDPYSNGFGGGPERPRFNPFWRHDEAWQDEKNDLKKKADRLLEDVLSIETLESGDRKKAGRLRGGKNTVAELCGQIMELMAAETGQGLEDA
ncbi:MAG: exodeoxyribonuclease V subunit gamma [Oxalobacter sp.]|nr:exodeoxyribonuclease V subunit gamma [Oxalobacter sp.]